MSVSPPPTIWGPSRPGQQWPAGASGSLLPLATALPRGKDKHPAPQQQGWCPKGQLQGASPHHLPHSLRGRRDADRSRPRCGAHWLRLGRGWRPSGCVRLASVPAWSPTRKPRSGAQGSDSQDSGSVQRARQAVRPAHLLSLLPRAPQLTCSVKMPSASSPPELPWKTLACGPRSPGEVNKGMLTNTSWKRHQGSLPGPPTDPEASVAEPRHLRPEARPGQQQAPRRQQGACLTLGPRC